MASQEPQLHFVLFPFMAQGHLIPMMDFAKVLVQHNVIVTVVTTAHNAARFESIVHRYTEAGFQIRVAKVHFPSKEFGLPEECENLDMLPTLGMGFRFFSAANISWQPVEKLFEELTPAPSCIISDMGLPYTTHIAKRFNISRIGFAAVSYFFLLCLHTLQTNNMMENKAAESEYFVLPGFSDKIEITKAQTEHLTDERWKEIFDEYGAASVATYGTIVNSFEELESAYAREYKKISNDKVWCIGPLSLSNKDHLDKAERGNRASIDECHLKCWLDCQQPGTVIYASLGSLCNLTSPQLIELGLALEASKRPFIWVIRGGSLSEAMKKWIKEEGFEERTNGRSLLIRGWAPQLLILSHPAIGGFITHCGWNSTLEAICAGVPMVSWPLFGDQFFNENLVVQILKVGVKVGAKSTINWGKEEEIGVVVKKKDIERAIESVMDESSESEERRKRVRVLAEVAKRAVEKGGSSHSDLTLLIQDIRQKVKRDM
ncbi:UDP-glycosyltransferase 73C2-like [Vigna umbellata]|uniref:UDP-glycosyltransferase 73C2-like n=1 Tax=Vigna umbellata TaxID=87088 RepID=UPI001F5E97F1|nr:UDP-glycosyltransferase 73C2-like [Vigna umbellata]